MPALLTADEAARLRVGERLVIVRPGDPPRHHPHCVPLDPPGKNRRWACKACRVVEHGIPQGRCSAPDREPCSWCGWVNQCAPDCPGVSIALGMAERVIGGEVHHAVADYERKPQPFVAPQAWVALGGPCPVCSGERVINWCVTHHPAFNEACFACWNGDACPDCRDGRRIEPLYTECPHHCQWGDSEADWCGRCDVADTTRTHPPRVLVGQGTIRVVPVLHWSDNDMEAPPCLSVGHDNGLTYLCVQLYGGHPFQLDPLPVPGRDFGIVIDCVEVL